MIAQRVTDNFSLKWHLSIVLLLIAFQPAHSQDTITSPFWQYGYGMFMCIALSPDGTRFVTGSSDGRLRVCDTETGGIILTIEGNKAPIRLVAFSPDGKMIASTVGYFRVPDYSVNIWDAQNGKLLYVLSGHTYPINKMSFSGNGLFLTGSSDSTARLWDLSTGKCTRIFPKQSNYVTAVAFSSDDSKVLTGTDGGIIKYWDIANDTALKTIDKKNYSIDDIAFCNQDTEIVFVADNDYVERWNLKADTVIKYYIVSNGFIKTLSISPDEQWIFAAPDIWNVSNEFPTEFYASELIPGSSFFPDGKRILTTSDNSILIIDAVTGNILKSFSSGYSSYVRSIAYSPDGKNILAGYSDGKARMLNAADGALVRTFTGHYGWINDVAFSNDGTKIVTGTGSWDFSAGLWDVTTGVCDRLFIGHKEDIKAVSISPDGSKLLTGSYGNIKNKTLILWDVATGDEIFSFDSTKIPMAIDVAFSPDGATFLTTTSNVIKLWKTSSGDSLQTLSGHRKDINAAAFSPDGKMIISGSIDSTALLWDVSSGTLLHKYDVHAAVYSVAFSPDGSTFLTGSNDNTMKLWDAKTGNCLKTFIGHTDVVRSVAFSPDGSKAASGSGDCTVRLWDIDENVSTRPSKVGRKSTLNIRIIAATQHSLTFELPASFLNGATAIDIFQLDGRLIQSIPVRKSPGSGNRVTINTVSPMKNGIYAFRFTGIPFKAKGTNGTIIISK